METNLNRYDNSWYKKEIGAGPIKRLLWYYTNLLIFNNGLLPVSALKVFLLKLFGARVGKGVNIKPSVNIKYPWKLTIGNYCWIGEKVWIDNLAEVQIGDHVCISQGAFLLTGNHNYSLVSFDLMVRSIQIGNGAWVGANAVVCPGVVCEPHAVLSVGSIATNTLEAYTIYQGNPARPIKKRTIQ